ncbi:hypothetical protein SD961_01520 [Erwinia sp. MMLR14_017]|uniref:hypothetical protein n=1 Tax=Erwinia sp. MMLR14_017 TaxID=3093842 RepID=UPI002990543E|nr:hypothetical protein [Erwinia sp. MMLR14_017]MDW8844580.1 hypothetical protein [Erwinia sp. MMLR14_017]
MQKPVKCDLSILELLKKVDGKHVNYLIDVLTDNGNGRLALSSSVKDLLLEEKAEQRYSDLGLRHLLRELQEYGGHSLVNVFRSEPLSYSELLTDVHKKLNGIDSKNKIDSQKEREIVFSLFGEGWQSLDDYSRWERCTENKVVAGFFKMQDNLQIDDKGMLIGLSAAASAAAFVALRMFPATALVSTLGIVNKSVGEAYRITIPFVAHVAMLKMIYSNKV